MGTRKALPDMKWVMTRPGDDELWSEAVNGDADAFGLLFERHARSVYNFCFRRTGDWTRAQDLTSVVFLECWRRRDATLARDKVLPWLLGIATNVCRTERRSLARHRAALARLPPPERAFEFTDEALDRLEDEHRMQALLSLVRRLPKRQQDVLGLCVWAELSYEDAAAALQIPVGTVRSRLARARARLRAHVVGNGLVDDSEAGVAPVLAVEELKTDER